MESTALEKTLGSALLFIGLAIIGYSLYSGVNVFMRAQNPPEIFKPANIAAIPAQTPADNANKALPKNLNEANPSDLQKMIVGNLIGPEMLKSVIPPEMFGYAPRLLNLSAFSIFLWVLIAAGAKVSALGVALVKTNSNVKV